MQAAMKPREFAGTLPARYSPSSRNTKGAQRGESVLFWRGLSVNEGVFHLFDNTVKGRVQKIVIPLVYVRLDGEKEDRVMDRDEIVGEEQWRRMQEQKERKKEDKLKKRRSYSDLPDVDDE